MAATDVWGTVAVEIPNPNDIHPPYLNADLYRVLSSKSNGSAPPYLDVIQIAPDGKALLGRSNLTGRLWNGMVQTVDVSEEIIKVVNEGTTVPTMMISNGIGDAKFMSDTTKIVIGDDCGDLSIWSRQQLWSSIAKPGDEYDAWCTSCSVCEHDDAIVTLDLSNLGDRIVTGGADNCIKVWDLSLIAIESHRPAHTHIISDIACHQSQNDIFLSSSLDGTVALWDSRNVGGKAKVLMTMPCAIRCICWLTENYFITGQENGDVSVFNLSQEFTSFKLNLNYPIHKVVYHASSKRLAVCGDSEKVVVFKVLDDMKLEKIYEDSRHERFVRGLSWKQNGQTVELYSCGWDNQILVHSFV